MSVMEKLLFVMVVELLATAHPQFLKNGDRCSPDGDICMELQNCQELHDPVRKGFRPKVCGFNGTTQIICCSEKVDEGLSFREAALSISEQMCLSYLEDICPSFSFAVLGGKEVAPKELPFMALIGYGPIGDIEWRCGGSLISNNFVLSAAHCTKLHNGVNASWVRLGELDLSTKKDEAKPQDFRIVERIDHPKYKSSLNYYDIALYRLHKEVEFTDYIRPICLDQSSSLNRFKTVVAAGWGNTETGGTSNILLKVELDLYNMSSCKQYETLSRAELPNGLKSDSQLCSGYNKGRRDTCNGDSGGPLFLPPTNDLRGGGCFLYTQIGITSFGPSVCGDLENPGVYTRVSAYRSWIELIVWRRKSQKPIWSS